MTLFHREKNDMNIMNKAGTYRYRIGLKKTHILCFPKIKRSLKTFGAATAVSTKTDNKPIQWFR